MPEKRHPLRRHRCRHASKPKTPGILYTGGYVYACLRAESRVRLRIQRKLHVNV
ncbi:hypothetical protein HMPREF9413_4601 [Paenibacillus sp. HGF7]|nr:hypothetical protein HMPREF9413_4601 [Paenibacillus sp. HGF7]